MAAVVCVESVEVGFEGRVVIEEVKSKGGIG